MKDPVDQPPHRENLEGDGKTMKTVEQGGHRKRARIGPQERQEDFAGGARGGSRGNGDGNGQNPGSGVPAFPDGERQHGGNEKTDTPEQDRAHPVEAVELLHHPAEDHRDENLGNDDEEIKDAHVDPDSVSGQNAGNHRIGHGNNAGGGDADPSEGKNQQGGIPQPKQRSSWPLFCRRPKQLWVIPFNISAPVS